MLRLPAQHLELVAEDQELNFPSDIVVTGEHQCSEQATHAKWTSESSIRLLAALADGRIDEVDSAPLAIWLRAVTLDAAR